MRFFATVLIVAAALATAAAQDMPYNLATVPAELKTNASVIVHNEDINVRVEDLDKMTLKVHRIFTVINEEGDRALLFNQYASRYLSLDDAEIKVYDAAGRQTGKYKKRDMTTISVGEGLIDDGFVTYYRIKPTSYPVTVEVNYEQRFKSTLGVPDYRFLHPGESVVASTYTATLPATIPFRYKARNADLKPVVADAGGLKTYRWTVKNLPAVADETGSSAGADKFPYVSMTTDNFSHYDYRGDLSSWQAFGQWISDLYKGLDVLPAERQAFFQRMVSSASTDAEKARRIYQYLQENFRYVSIQLGIGGLRPFSAAFTDQKKYGDCKGLSNYMKAALQSVGVRSHVAIINARYDQEPVDPDFPANNFDHVILCIPGTKDSTWLECTSNTTEFGVLGTFTENRNALLITEAGGVLVPTPKSKAAANQLSTRTVMKMLADLSATAETTFSATGDFGEMMADVMKDKPDDQKEFLMFGMGYRQPDDFKLASANGSTQLTMAIRKLPEFNSGDKFFLNPRINKVWTSKLPTAQGRKMDFYFRYPFIKHDTTILQLPPGFTTDVLPPAKTIASAYTEYSSKYWFNQAENAVYTATTLVLQRHKIPATDYANVKTFFDEVSQDYTQKLVLKRSATAVEEKKAF